MRKLRDYLGADFPITLALLIGLGVGFFFGYIVAKG